MLGNNNTEEKTKGILGRLLEKIYGKFIGIIIVAVIAAAIGVLGTTIWQKYNTQDKTIAIGFEDIGELATQESRVTKVKSVDKSMDFFGLFDMPFTHSNVIFSYDFEIKAGYDFSEIKWDVDEEKKVVMVTLPQVKTFGSRIDPKSFKVYNEKSSAFNPIKLKEFGEETTKMNVEAEKEAIEAGLLDKARVNGEKLITGMLKQHFEDYRIEFK
ncbi:DUF4230 domain-containing protein [Eubacterium xylanophilum]|uniref:DUF4230 domain-containing protein n=1 Tax=Eubacterium xylanophilum TaxID=39497 RepID=UPI0004B1407A|nr:DUF4230 domain-containing protein [Eubacterium xylanophilum]